jgi:predicted exporter
VFAAGATLEEALQVNEKLYTHLRQEFSSSEIVSLAPVLPSSLMQVRNRRHWHAFWTSERLAKLQENLISAGREIGFSATAFTPFMAALTASPPGLSESYWRRAGFAPLLAALIEKSPQKVTIITLIPDRAANLQLFNTGQIMPGVRLVSPQSFSREVSSAVSSDLKRFIVWALIVVSLILLILLRNFYQALLALLPVLTGLLSMFGIMGALGISFNIFNLVAAILIIGVGVDYGIFMVYRLFRERDAATEKAVLVSGLTTLAGFGVLVLARHPALYSIGLTVLLGVGGALPTVLWVLPALAAMRNRGN